VNTPHCRVTVEEMTSRLVRKDRGYSSHPRLSLTGCFKERYNSWFVQAGPHVDIWRDIRHVYTSLT
jgi:hypothetical protein